MSLKNFEKKFDTVCCEKETTIQEIASLMKEHEVGTVLVKENDEPVGMVTDRDLVIRCLAEDKELSAYTAEDVMTEPVHSVSRDSSILELIEEMKDKEVRRICVTSEDGAPIGIVSMGDVFELLAHEIGQLSEAAGTRHGKLFHKPSGFRAA